MSLRNVLHVRADEADGKRRVHRGWIVPRVCQLAIRVAQLVVKRGRKVRDVDLAGIWELVAKWRWRWGWWRLRRLRRARLGNDAALVHPYRAVTMVLERERGQRNKALSKVVRP